MPTHVYANNNEVASKAADGKSIAAFPDVCFSPPAPPVGPMPLPYPNTGEVKDTDSGTAKVFIKDKMSGMAGDSNITKSMGDESATQNFNKGMITGALQGKCYFGLWSMDVQMEGKGVPRHLDMVTHNHASEPGNDPAGVALQGVSPATSAQPGIPPGSEICYEIRFVNCTGDCIPKFYFAANYNNNTANRLFSPKWNKDLKTTVYRDGNQVYDAIPEENNAIYIHASKYDVIISIQYDMIKDFLIYFMNQHHSISLQDIKMENFIYIDLKYVATEDGPQVFERILPRAPIELCAGDNNKLCKYALRLFADSFFPILRAGAWNQDTAYNLAVLSDVAYADHLHARGEEENGSPASVFRALAVGEKATSKAGDNLILERLPADTDLYYLTPFTTSISGYILYTTHKIIIAFQGTNSFQHALKDLNILPTKFGYCDGEVHSGFWNGYHSIKNLIAGFFEMNAGVLYKTDVYITGHSLGGALALLCASHISTMRPECQPKSLNVYTYGMPRAISPELLSNQKINEITHFRHIYKTDIVPRALPNIRVWPGQQPHHHGTACYLSTPLTPLIQGGPTHFNLCTKAVAKALGGGYFNFIFSEKHTDKLNSVSANYGDLGKRCPSIISGIVQSIMGVVVDTLNLDDTFVGDLLELKFMETDISCHSLANYIAALNPKK